MPGRHYDMWIDGSDIRFMRCTLPEMKYMFHALYTQVSDRTPGNAIAYGTADELRKRSYMYHVRRLLAEGSDMRARVVGSVFGALTMTLCVHLWVGFETCYWEHYIREMHLIQT